MSYAGIKKDNTKQVYREGRKNRGGRVQVFQGGRKYRGSAWRLRRWEVTIEEGYMGSKKELNL